MILRKVERLIHFLLQPFRKLLCMIRSLYYSSYIDEGKGKIVITEPFLKFSIQKSAASKFHLNGILTVTSHLNGKSPVCIILANQSCLKIEGDFIIGHGVKITLNTGSQLVIGGKDKESASGITAETIIMVNKSISIGKDFVCAWNVFISDSDWHSIEGQSHQKNIEIGNHVWIANSCSILKGSVIGDNSIIASHSKVINYKSDSNSLLAGTPAKVVKSAVHWQRDI